MKGIQDARAKREWERAVYWGKKKKDRAVLIHCEEIVRNFPQTQYAELARAKIKELGGTDIEPGSISVDDGNIQPFASEPAPVEDEGPVFTPTAPVIDPPPGSNDPPGRVRL